MNSSNFRIVLGVTGSISATKSQQLLITLRRKYGCEVRVAMTRSAQKFLGELSLRGVLQEAPYLDIWNSPQGGGGEIHVEWGNWADAILVYPCTASLLSRLWCGQYDDPVSLVASMIPEERWMFAPGMAAEMWTKRATQRNVHDLRSWGAQFFGPVPGKVASGLDGMRLQEPRETAEQVIKSLEQLGARNRA